MDKLIIQNQIFPKGILIAFPEKSLNNGRKKFTNTIAAKKAKPTTKNDSEKNWLINWPLMDPMVFLIPTSFARFSERAVLKFIKFIHASSKIKLPMIIIYRTNCPG